jgi:DNA primase
MIQRKLHPDCIEEVKERTDIVDLISGFVGLKKRGQEFLGLCPFHDEKTPSFSVSPTKKLAYCFGCSWGGNAIKFLMELNKVSFTDAVMDLARSTGVRIQYEDGSSDDDYPVSLPRPHQPITPVKQQEQSEPQKDYTVDERRVIASVKRLLSGEGDAAKALKWLHQRGITREIIKRYQLGLEKRVVTPNEFNPEKKETYWAIAIFIPVPNRLGRFYVKKRVAPWLSDGERPSYLGKWAQFGVPASIWFTHNPDEAQETWFCEGEWDALLLGELARQQGKKVAVACSTAGAGSLPKQEELCRLPGVVTTFFDRDDAGTKALKS